MTTWDSPGKWVCPSCGQSVTMLIRSAQQTCNSKSHLKPVKMEREALSSTERSRKARGTKTRRGYALVLD